MFGTICFCRKQLILGTPRFRLLEWITTVSADTSLDPLPPVVNVYAGVSLTAYYIDFYDNSYDNIVIESIFTIMKTGYLNILKYDY